MESIEAINPVESNSQERPESNEFIEVNNLSTATNEVLQIEESISESNSLTDTREECDSSDKTIAVESNSNSNGELLEDGLINERVVSDKKLEEVITAGGDTEDNTDAATLMGSESDEDSWIWEEEDENEFEFYEKDDENYKVQTFDASFSFSIAIK